MRIRNTLLGVVVTGIAAGTLSTALAATHTGTSHGATNHTASAATATPAVKATNALALKLLPKLGGSGNATLSPLSIETALAMVAQGARGGTATAFTKLLAGYTPQTIAPSNSRLAAELQKDAGSSTTLNTAASLWVQSGFRLENTFTTTLQDDFGAAPTSVDFSGDPTAAANQINNWTSQKTDGLIPEVMPPGSITNATVLTLVSAIYLHALWASPFDANQTTSQPFHETSSTNVTAQYMTSENPTSFPYTVSSGYTAVELPYKGSSLSMLVVMPSQGTIGAFQRTLTPKSLATVVAKLKDGGVKLSFPKIDLSLHSSLNGVLSQLGLGVAFGNGADFGGITRSTGLQIQDVEHAAVLKVNEAGTTAAAATGISVEPTAIFVGGRIIDVDHPYLLFLRDNSSGAILFAARVVNPASS